MGQTSGKLIKGRIEKHKHYNGKKRDKIEIRMVESIISIYMLIILDILKKMDESPERYDLPELT